MRFTLRACAGPVLALCLAAPPALADGPDDVRPDEDAGAAAQPPAPGPARPRFGDELVVVGRRGRTSDATAAATVVDAGRFAGEAKSVGELVGTAPGVAVSAHGSPGQLTTVSIRGSSADQVRVFLDGLPLDTAAGGGTDLSRIPRAWIERIEVLRGAEGARFGAGALGGVVNIVTRPAAAGAWSAEASAGSFTTGALSADGALGGPDRGLMGALAAEGTGGAFPFLYQPTPSAPVAPIPLVRAHNASLQGGALVKGWTAWGPGQLDGVVQLSAGARELPGPAYATTPEDEQRDRRLGLVARWARPLGEDWSLALEAHGRADQLDLTLAALGGEADQRSLEGGARARVTWASGPSTASAAAVAGWERYTSAGAGGPQEHARPTLALVLADDLALADGGLRLAPALRLEQVGDFRGLSAKLGAALRLGGPWSARASGGRTFRPPSFGELYLQQGQVVPNPALAPETAWSADAALVADGRLGVASLGGFLTLYDDLVVYEPAFANRFKPFNDARARAAGLEAELATAPLGTARLTGALAYTLLVTETLRGTDLTLGQELPHRPRHRLFARVGVAPGALSAHAEAQYVSLQYLDAANLASVPAALTFDLGGAVRLARDPDVRIDLEVRNLLDDRSLQDGFGNPLPGRTVMLSLRVSGGKDAPP